MPTGSPSRSIEGAARPSARTGARRCDGGSWRPIRAGEFILGYPDEEDVLPAAPPPDELSTNGSFLVYRKLHQDVAAFRAQLAEAAAHYPGGEELLAAKIVGRWRDGTPIDALAGASRRVDRERPHGATTRSATATTPTGCDCPVGAHVRRANPRDSLPFEGKLVNRHRLIRRGIPYGEPLAARRRGRRTRSRRDLHVPAGEHRAAVRVHPVPVVQPRQLVRPRLGPGRPAGSAGRGPPQQDDRPWHPAVRSSGRCRESSA